MKKIITKVKKMSLGIFASVLFAGSASATTYTATTSGNWSSAITWGGSGSPGSTLGLTDNVIIPAGLTVNLDMDVNAGITSSINVSGQLITSTNSLTISQGTLQGSGYLHMMYLEIGNLGTLSFTGGILADRFVNSGATITLGGNVSINDSLILNSGSISVGSGASLSMMANSIIKVSAGTISVSTGTVSAISNYDVLYVGSTKTSGIETNFSTGAQNIWVNLSDSSQIVTMGKDITVSGTVHHTMGKLAIGAHTLKMMGDYVATSNAKITGIATSRLMLGSSSAITSSIAFSNGSQFQYLESNLSGAASASLMGNFSVDTIYAKNGSMSFANSSTMTILTNGVMIVENGTFTLGTGIFTGTNTYGVIYRGGNKSASFELSGTGLHNVTVDMASNTNAVTILGPLKVAGLLNLNKGSLDISSNKLFINGTFMSTANGTLQGNSTSTVKVNNTAAAFGDTLNFMASAATLDSLTINTMASNWVWLGSGLNVKTLNFTSGGLMLTSGDLILNSNGVIVGNDSTKYVGTSGSGSLVMNVNLSTPYVVFPVGTNTSYSPAWLQLNSGTAGMFHVNVQNGMWSNGTGGNNLALAQSVVDRTWYIQEPTQSGSLSANMKLEWKASDEKNGFDRSNAFISHYTNSAWDASAISNSYPTTGSFNTMTRYNVTSFSPFAVVDKNATITAGIDKVTAGNLSIGLYPNPTANVVTIDFKNTDAKTVEVYDEIGNKVYANDITNKNTLHKIDISSLPAGIYYVKVSTSTEPIFKKLIKA